jgi:hypothetical protein
MKQHPSIPGAGVLVISGIFIGLSAALGLIAQSAGWWFVIAVVAALTLAVFGSDILRALRRRHVRRLRQARHLNSILAPRPSKLRVPVPLCASAPLRFNNPPVNGHHPHPERKPL